MKFHTKKRRAPSIIIVSLIDILAILLIFFIVTTTFQKNQPQLQINLPDSKSAETAPAEKDQPILLRIKSGTELSLDGKPVAIESLADALAALRTQSPGRAIAMQADREAPFGVVVAALDALKAAGVKNVPAFTQPQGGK
ncbi:MAG TPA: biopolymer transporter ExbD [Terrimicrobiaceae bacterium]|nr:biopolymer transporter ExbD [Terrimicrobiaceae bacterium]